MSVADKLEAEETLVWSREELRKALGWSNASIDALEHFLIARENVMREAQALELEEADERGQDAMYGGSMGDGG